jgi:hypothetical protein
VVEALKKRRIDPKDFERWNRFRSSLKQTIEFWKYYAHRPQDTFLPPCPISSSPPLGVSPITIAPWDYGRDGIEFPCLVYD